MQIQIFNYTKELVMGPGQNFLTQAGSDQFFVARVGSGQLFMVWVWIWKISPKNVKFQFFPFGSKKISSGGVKKYPGRPLIYCGSKVSSGWVRAHLYKERILFLNRHKSFPIFFLKMRPSFVASIRLMTVSLLLFCLLFQFVHYVCWPNQHIRLLLT